MGITEENQTCQTTYPSKLYGHRKGPVLNYRAGSSDIVSRSSESLEEIHTPTRNQTMGRHIITEMFIVRWTCMCPFFQCDRDEMAVEAHDNVPELMIRPVVRQARVIVDTV